MDFDDASQMKDAAVVTLLEKVTQKADQVAAAAGKEASAFFNSGAAVQARTAASDKAAAARRHDAYMDPSALTGQAKGAEFEWADLPAIQDALRKVRDDNDPTTWMTAGYVDKKTIALIATGTASPDPIPELLASLKDGTNCFGVFRVTEKIDKTTAVRFCFVTWQPPDVPVMTRSVQATHRGGVVPVFRPFNHDFSISSRDELTYESCMDTLMKLSGTKSMVTDAKPTAKEPEYQRQFLGGVKDEAQKLDVVDADALAGAVKAVRNDADATRWVVANYKTDGKSLALQLKASGSGGVDEFAACLAEDPTQTTYGIVRVQQTIDGRTQATKFVFVTFAGPETPPTVKGKVSTLRGAVLPHFHPYHAEMLVDSVGEVTEDSVMKRL